MSQLKIHYAKHCSVSEKLFFLIPSHYHQFGFVIDLLRIEKFEGDSQPRKRAQLLTIVEGPVLIGQVLNFWIKQCPTHRIGPLWVFFKSMLEPSWQQEQIVVVRDNIGRVAAY